MKGITIEDNFDVRHKLLKSMGRTNGDIGDRLGCSEGNIRRILNPDNSISRKIFFTMLANHFFPDVKIKDIKITPPFEQNRKRFLSEIIYLMDTDKDKISSFRIKSHRIVVFDTFLTRPKRWEKISKEVIDFCKYLNMDYIILHSSKANYMPEILSIST